MKKRYDENVAIVLLVVLPCAGNTAAAAAFFA